jgi:hypothetical protein
MAHATRLAQALRLDLAAQWTPTKESYLSRVTKAQILQARARSQRRGIGAVHRPSQERRPQSI